MGLGHGGGGEACLAVDFELLHARHVCGLAATESALVYGRGRSLLGGSLGMRAAERQRRDNKQQQGPRRQRSARVHCDGWVVMG